jgi:hypothetical protein
VAQRKTLTEQQVSLLRWIANGCPDGVMQGESHRISTAALRNRGLVKTSGRGSTWKATITVAGREYLDRVDGSDPPVPRRPNVSVTQQLVDDVIAAGGSMRVPYKRWADPDSIDYANRARLAERYRKVPRGKRLVVAPVDGELEIRLVDAPDRADPVELAGVEVPEKVARYHRAARQFRDVAKHHEVSRQQLKRATRIIHTIATEAERRGWSAQPPGESQDAYGRSTWSGPKAGHLRLAAEGHEFWLRLHEDGVRTRGPWEEEVKRYRNSPGWLRDRDRDQPSGPYDAKATGELKLELFCERYWIFSGRQSRWSDRQSWRLEERLPHLFRELAERVVEAKRVAEEERIKAEQAAEAARREAEERERKWHELMAQAKERLIEAHRAKHLSAQADSWHAADRLRRYCDALESAHGDDSEAAEWIAWARAFADRIDPLTEPPKIPDPPEPTPEALQEFLPEGWSAYGPEHRYAPRRLGHDRYLR